MLLIALILLVVGVVLLVAVPFPNASGVGWALVLVGLILLVFALAGGAELQLRD